MATKDRARGGAPASRATLSAVGWIADVTTNRATGVIGESRKHKAAKLLRQIPCIGPIRAARLLALMQTPHRFRSKRQLWTYSGLGIETRDSAQYRFVRGQLQRAKKPQQIRGLNKQPKSEMKQIFKGAATRASCGVGPLRDFYVILLDKGMKPEMARLTLARKIAAIALTLWKKEERFDAEQLKTKQLERYTELRGFLSFHAWW